MPFGPAERPRRLQRLLRGRLPRARDRGGLRHRGRVQARPQGDRPRRRQLAPRARGGAPGGAPAARLEARGRRRLRGHAPARHADERHLHDQAAAARQVHRLAVQQAARPRRGDAALRSRRQERDGAARRAQGDGAARRRAQPAHADPAAALQGGGRARRLRAPDAHGGGPRHGHQ